MDVFSGSENQKSAQPQNKKDNPILNFLSRLAREVTAILVWAYVLIKLFVFDIDIFLLQRLSPNYVWILNYKFFILIGTIALIWLVTKNKTLLLWFLFVFFYPAIILFWRIPFLIFKQKSWNLAFAASDSIISLFKNFKTTFVITSLFLVFVAAILGFSNKVLTWISVAALTVIVLWVYVQRLIFVIKPAGVYEIYSKLLSMGGENIRKIQRTESADGITLVPVENMDEDQLEQWKTNVQQLVMQHRLCLFVAKKLRSYHDSGFPIISSVLSTLMLVLYTAFAFGVINLGLYKIDYHSYSFSTPPTFFAFLYFSFSRLLNTQIPEIVPAMPISQVASMVESFFALFLLGIFVSLVFTVKNQRSTDELNAVIKKLNEEGSKLEGFIKEMYRFDTIEEAMEALRHFHSSMIDLIYKITAVIA